MLTVNRAAFDAEIRQIIDKDIPAIVLSVQRTEAGLVTSDVVNEPHPYKTGQAIANWNASLDTPDRSKNMLIHLSPISRMAAMTLSLTKAQGFIRLMQAFDVFYFTNTVDYIEDLEFGTATRPGVGMVRMAVARAQQRRHTGGTGMVAFTQPIGQPRPAPRPFTGRPASLRPR